MSGVRLSRALPARMSARDWGRIVFVSSESAVQIPVEMIHYGMTKTAQLGGGARSRRELAGTGVTVNAVLPGPTLSEGVAGFMRQMAAGEADPDLQAMGRDFIKANRPTSLLGRLIDPEEVASLIAYLCSPAASATTGSALRADGGVVRAVL